MSDHKPGTVALVTFQPDDMLSRCTLRGIRWAAGWHVVDVGGSYELVHDRYVTDVRPLVVLDLGDTPLGDTDPASWLRDFAKVADALPARDWTFRVALLNSIADQIAAQTKPPKPAEPTGLGAVVEDAEGVRWILVDRRNGVAGWHHCDASLDRPWRFYDDITAFRVLSEGVQA